MNVFKIISLNISMNKGEKKTPTEQVELKEDYGIIGDAHADGTLRQVSLLAQESVDKIKSKGMTVKPGDFAENITTQGVELHTLAVGTKIKLGKEVEIEITQIGKECHDRCNIYAQVGDCVMPREGVFAKVLKGGILHTDDTGFLYEI